jgi:tetratricopeptide (TPR) repeat protein
MFAAMAAALLTSPLGAQPLPPAQREPPPATSTRLCFSEEAVEFEQRMADCTAIAESPNEPPALRAQAYLVRGYFYFNSGDARRAIADYTAAIKLDPKLVAAYMRRAEAFRDEGETDRALADYTEAIRIDPNNPDLYRERARLYRDQGDRARAAADFTEAIRIDPQDDDTYRQRGHLLIELEEFDRAVATYTQALAVDPDDTFKNPFHLGMRGFAHFFRGDYRAATADFETAVELLPNSPDNGLRLPFYFIARARLGEDGSAMLAAQIERWEQMAKSTPGTWLRDAPVLYLFLGRTTPGNLLNATARQQVAGCQAEYFVGQWHLLKDDREQSRAHLQTAASQKCEWIYVTYVAARVELKRMNR